MQGEIRYRVIFSGRRSISLIVSPDKGVIVRAPYGTSLKSIERFVGEKSEWINRHLEMHSRLTRINHGREYSEGEIHLFMGREYRLKLKKSEQLYVRADHDALEVATNNTGDAIMIRALLERFYRHQAENYLAGRFEDIAGRLRNKGYIPASFCVRALKSRWGSCSFHGKITISSELIKLDPVFADYVIVHEMCHLKHHNHGKEFYRSLEELIPDYKSIRKALRQYLTR
jgi:hypothetical protein